MTKIEVVGSNVVINIWIYWQTSVLGKGMVFINRLEVDYIQDSL